MIARTRLRDLDSEIWGSLHVFVLIVFGKIHLDSYPARRFQYLKFYRLIYLNFNMAWVGFEYVYERMLTVDTILYRTSHLAESIYTERAT